MAERTDYRFDGGEYEILRAKAGFITGLALPAKVRWCSYLLFADALVLPAVLALPAGVRSAYVPGDPASAQLALSWMAIAGAGVVFVAGVALAWLARRRAQVAAPTSEQATWLVGVESMLSAIGFVTGGTAVAVALAGTGAGFAGTAAVSWLVDHGVTPYRAAAVPSVERVAALALVLGVVLAVLGRRVEAP